MKEDGWEKKATLIRTSLARGTKIQPPDFLYNVQKCQTLAPFHYGDICLTSYLLRNINLAADKNFCSSTLLNLCDLVTVSELILFLIPARYLQKYPI